MRRILKQMPIAVAGLGLAGTAAAAVSVGNVDSIALRFYYGALLGLAGALPGAAAVFALLNAMFCHPGRSKVRQALLGAAVGSGAYVLCVVIGSVSLGPLLDTDHPLREDLARLLLPFAHYAQDGFWALVIALYFLPALPLAAWSVWHAHSAPKAPRPGASN